MNKKEFSVILFNGSQDIWEEVSKITGLNFKLDIDNLPECRTRENGVKQYSAHDLLDYVSKNSERGIGVVDVDLFIPELNFVFGLSSPSKQASVVSTARLGNKRSRIIKEAVHELGHLVGLSHCYNSDCVMHFSNRVEHTDKKGKEFCKSCRNHLKSKSL